MADNTPETQSIYVETYGCQMNALDSEIVQGHFERCGYRCVDAAEAATVVLLNTCSVRDLAEHKVWSQLGRLGPLKSAKGGKLVVGVIGCMAERQAAAIAQRMPHVDIICGPSHLSQLPTLVETARAGAGVQIVVSGHTRRHDARTAAHDMSDLHPLSHAASATPHLPSSTTNRRQKAPAFVRITQGCNKFCSFCVVPYTRGPEEHRAPQAIVDEVRALADQGVLEVTLIGQTVNHYVGVHNGRRVSFADLLWQVHEAVPTLPRLRFVTSYPRDFGDDALDVMAAAPRICRYLHLPAQSGSNRLLQLMNRGYTTQEYEALLERARARMPEVSFAGDMIVGFPSETEADHAASMVLLRRARYSKCYVFKYSARAGTVAARRFTDDVAEEIKRQRNADLLEVQAAISKELHTAMVGKTVPVLVDSIGKTRHHDALPAKPLEQEVRLGWQQQHAAHPDAAVRLMGRTMGDDVVAFEGPAALVGQIVTVRLTRASTLVLDGVWTAAS